MIGIDPAVWRIIERDIPRREWLATEVMDSIDGAGTTWREFHAS